MYKDALNCRAIFKLSVTNRGLTLHAVAEFKFMQCNLGGMFTAELLCLNVYQSLLVVSPDHSMWLQSSSPTQTVQTVCSTKERSPSISV